MSAQNTQSRTIARNRRARFDYSLERTYQAGMVLEGWEIKSIRAGKVQLRDTYVTIRNEEAFLQGCQITPLSTASTHQSPDPKRSRKLLLNRREIREIAAAVQIKGKSCVALSFYWNKQFVKCEIAIATGKREYDKRKTIQEREWNRQKQRLKKQALG